MVEEEKKPMPWRPPTEPDPDGYLHTWVYLTNRWGAELPLSLLIGGALVTGQTISWEAWLRAIESQIRDAPTETPEGIDGLLQGLKEARIETSADDLEDRDEPYRFIHLKDASVYGFGPPFTVPYWRGRLTAVDSWWLGETT